MGAVEEEIHHPAMLHHTLQQHPMGHGPPPGWAPLPNFPQHYGYLPPLQAFGPPFFPAGPPMQLYQYGPPPPSFPMMVPFPQPMMMQYAGVAAWPDKAEHQSRADALVGNDQRRWAGMPLESLENEIVELAFSRNGSLYLQSKLSVLAEDEAGALVTTADPQAFAMILRELGPVLDKVMQDKYGSYLTRWLVQLSTSEQRVQIWTSLADSKLVETCCTHSGKWTIHELIMAARTVTGEDLSAAINAMTKPLPTVRSSAPRRPTDEFDRMATTLGAKLRRFDATPAEMEAIQSSLSQDDIITLFRERDGAHVIKAFVLFMKPSDRQFIYDAAQAHVMRLATDRYGGATLQRLLDASGGQEQRMQLASAVTQKAAAMVGDPQANYILQHVLTMGSAELVNATIDALRGQFVKLSKQKFGSNVVEKCIQSGEWALSQVAEEILSAAAAPATGGKLEGGVETLLGDRYGNYVVQALLQRCDLDGDTLVLLRDRIVDYDRTHRRWAQSVMGKRVLQKLIKRMQKRAKRNKAMEKEKEAKKVVDDLLAEDGHTPRSSSSIDGEDSPGSSA